jgi:hypothetical protein
MDKTLFSDLKKNVLQTFYLSSETSFIFPQFIADPICYVTSVDWISAYSIHVAGNFTSANFSHVSNICCTDKLNKSLLRRRTVVPWKSSRLWQHLETLPLVLGNFNSATRTIWITESYSLYFHLGLKGIYLAHLSGLQAEPSGRNGIAGLNPAGSMDVCLLHMLCCPV